MRGILVATLIGFAAVGAVSSSIAAYKATAGQADFCGFSSSSLGDELPAVVMRARVK